MFDSTFGHRCTILLSHCEVSFLFATAICGCAADARSCVVSYSDIRKLRAVWPTLSYVTEITNLRFDKELENRFNSHRCDVLTPSLLFSRSTCLITDKHIKLLSLFLARFGGVHAFDVHSAENEPIWMKFGTLWVNCRGLTLADFGRDPRRSDSWRARRNFNFFVR